MKEIIAYLGLDEELNEEFLNLLAPLEKRGIKILSTHAGSIIAPYTNVPFVETNMDGFLYDLDSVRKFVDRELAKTEQ